MKKFLFLAILLSLAGCKWFTTISTPMYFGSNIKIPDGTPTFQKGFKDGCSSVLYARGNVYYRTKYDYQYDPKMIGNPEYRFGHSRGYSWCFQTSIGPQGTPFSPDKYLFPNGNNPVFDMGAENIASNWGGMFDGVWGSSVTTPTNGLDGIFDVLQKGGSGTGATAFGTNPLWAGSSSGQFFGQ